MNDPRATLRYQRMEAAILLIQKRGPLDLTQLCNRLKLDERAFKDARYSLPGQLALEDHGVTMPRPVASEDYVYKLATSYRSGPVETDGEPNIQASTAEILTRVATTYSEVDQLISKIPGRSNVRRLLQRLQKALELTIISANDAALASNAPVSAKAEHVLSNIFPPGPAVVIP